MGFLERYMVIVCLAKEKSFQKKIGTWLCYIQKKKKKEKKKKERKKELQIVWKIYFKIRNILKKFNEEIFSFVSTYNISQNSLISTM